ncbi:MAG: SpoIIE family protein phosphatase [Nitrospiraceae bacterium]
MKLKHMFPIFIIVAIAMASITLWLMLARLAGALDAIAVVEERRSESLTLADELLRSSNDLTRFARLYAQSGDSRFLLYYRKVLDIQNGSFSRPERYDGTFWDRVIGGNVQLLDTGTGQTLSLRDRMHRLGFSQKEFELLTDVQSRSEDLTSIENLAFNAVKGRYYDPLTKTYSREGPQNLKLAQSLLLEPKYFKGKASIMELIGQFKEEVNARTTKALEVARIEAKKLLVRTFTGGGVLLGGLLIVFGIVTHRKVLQRISAVAVAAEQVAAGNLEVRSRVRGKDELGILGETFDHMISRLTESLTLVEAAKARMEEELNVGRDIQMSLLPHRFPAFPDRTEFDLFAVLEPTRETGGDLYDFFMVDAHRLGFAIGDVSGTGVSAALFMAMTKIVLKTLAAYDPSPASIVTHVNDALSAENDNCMFVTLYLGILNLHDGTLLTTNAGHFPPLLKRRGGQFEWLKAQDGPLVGPMPGITFKESKTQLAPGDELFFYTDGVTEADNVRRELFGKDRLKTVLDQSTSGSVVDRIRDVMQAVKTFVGDAPQADDITMLALRYNGVAPSDAAAPVFRQMMPNQLMAIPVLQTAFEHYVAQWERAKPLLPTLNMALDDLLSNVVQYGFPNDPEEHSIRVEGEVRGEYVILTITDDGVPFNPLAVAAPDLSLPHDERDIGGLGIHLVRSMFDELSYHRTVGHNVLTIKKKLVS